MNEILTNVRAVMSLFGARMFLGFIASLFNNDVGGAIFIYSLMGLIVTFFITIVVGFFKYF